MCFSAASSFSAATILLIIGTWSIKKNHNPSGYMFAVIPIFFALQQEMEGIIWLTLVRINQPLLHSISLYIYLLCALALWPAWIPFSLARIEPLRERRIILGVFTLLGVIISLYGIYQLILFPAKAEIRESSIYYIFGAANRCYLFYFILYIVPTTFSFFASSIPLMRITGSAVLASLVMTYYIKLTTLTSVWCFFAALLSILTVILVDQINLTPHRKKSQ